MAEQGTPPFFQDIPFAKRWECHKPTIKDLYIDQDLSAREVAQRMKEQYKFDALERQYKYQLRKWDITKKVPSNKKEAAIIAIGKRTRDVNSSLAIKYHGEEVDKKRLRRYINTTEKAKLRQEQGLQLSSNVFTHWNLPYRARQMSTAAKTSGPFASTPSDVSVGSPHPTTHVGAASATSPLNAPSPTMLAIRGKTLNDRAFLFAKGEHEQLLSQMERLEKKNLTTWLYQFWLFSFKTAKHWGYRPQDWTAELLEFERYRDRQSPSLANTPAFNAATPQNPATPGFEVGTPYVQRESSVEPSRLCRWSIHAAIPNEWDTPNAAEGEHSGELDLTKDHRSWPKWPTFLQWQSLDDKLQQALQNNSFSHIKLEDLPLAFSQIAKISKRSPIQLLQEAFSFSIIARSEEMFWKLLSRMEDEIFEDTGLYPFHLATSYLDGSKTCCNILDASLTGLKDPWKILTNDQGHTVLDNLFIAILKGHTSCAPVTVDDAFRKLRRFPGEEVDICGRWDADSVCVRELFANGDASIPFEWKHVFCHTSVQVITHCIGRISGPCWAPDINTSSGLFLKRCQSCGESLKLLPLHSLVLIAFHLARSGCEGETLFGMLACLVCLLANGADPGLKTPISLKALMGRDNAEECSHEYLSASELAEQVPENLMTSWTEEVKLGWEVFCTMLSFAKDERRPTSTQRQRQGHKSDRDRTHDFDGEMEDAGDAMSIDALSEDEGFSDEDDADEESCMHFKVNFYGRSKTIGTLWAAIQTELLTYRRLNEGDPWISENFNMRSLLNGLKNGGIISIRLVENDMMNSYCQCGRFLDIDDEACACVAEACSDYFCNLEDWDRSTYIHIPDGGNFSWYDF
ncbi:hypothetical protein B0J14DRAFT_66218 [Halenospora varia]|nr:hypothetical protein B0J14DRAFT_66218 [Halenospora varia]